MCIRDSNKSDATTEEYLSAIENINAAIAEFYSYVNPSENLVYNYIRTSDAATSLYAAQSEVTKDNYTCLLYTSVTAIW